MASIFDLMIMMSSDLLDGVVGLPSHRAGLETRMKQNKTNKRT